MATWKRVALIGAVVLVVVMILGAISSPAANVAPPTRAELSAYTENRDADAAEEVVAYFQLFDDDDDATGCTCDVRYEYGDEEDGIWQFIQQDHAESSDFSEVTIGIGAFERDGYVFATVLDGHDVRCADSYGYDLRVTVMVNGLHLQAVDHVFC